ncbi:MAG: hypothetical protein H0T65_02590, partial [Deltaproteobacteria bacterium]|nr:hypothetical protein [Deltaproteobacteria bacterium]
RWLIIGAFVGAFAAIVVVAGVTIINRIETGRWEVPDKGDFMRVASGRPRPASKTIFLARQPLELVPGVDDAPRGVSSVLANAANKPMKLPGWKGNNATWSKLVACVREQFHPFDVTVTDERPLHEDFVLVAVGGKPADLGIKDKRIGGLAPFNGEVIPVPVVYAFSAALRHDVRAICETIAMEVAHAYGLDHGYECKDVMTYLTGCGAKKFVDKEVRCGEKKARDCEGGTPTQNSYKHLISVLGSRSRP